MTDLPVDLGHPLEPIERLVARAERHAEQQWAFERMSLCEWAGAHVFTFGQIACACGEELAG